MKSRTLRRIIDRVTRRAQLGHAACYQRPVTPSRIVTVLLAGGLLGGCAADGNEGPGGSGGNHGHGGHAGSQGGTGGGPGKGGSTGGGGITGSGGAPAGGASAGGAVGSGAGGASDPGSTDASSVAAEVATEVSAGEVAAPAGAVVWAIDNLQRIGGHATTVVGAPMVIDTPGGRAVQFDGKDDALFVDKHPLTGLSEFTVEVIFRPDAGGAGAQRFFHMDESGGGRVLFETRLPGNDGFVADVFVQSRAGTVALYAPKNVHPLGAWYNVTAVIDGKRARHYVNGVEEMSVNLGFTPHGPGRTSIGVRINRLYYFKGAIRMARFTPRALAPSEFLQVQN